MLCFIAGIIGILLGFLVYEGLIYGVSKFVSKIEFEWILDSTAIIFSFISIFAVGILSGLVPAYRAEKLEVIEALRSE